MHRWKRLLELINLVTINNNRYQEMITEGYSLHLNDVLLAELA